MSCPHFIQKKPESTVLTIHCHQCTHGQATIVDPTCRTNILSLLQQELGITQLILNHRYIKSYQEKSLTYLKELSRYKEEITIEGKIAKKDETFTKQDVFSQLQHLKKHPDLLTNDTFKQIRLKTPLVQQIPEKVTSSTFFHDYLRPYVRPGFIDSSIQVQPPPDAIFESTYSIASNTEKQATVTLYSRKNTPEKFYFLLPSEFQLSNQDIQLLEIVQQNLSYHQPKTASFIESENTRNYFKRFAKQTIADLNQKNKYNLSNKKISQLADMFAQYTAGLGIIEDVLADPNIQDVYVNAPVHNNPLHIVVNGEEYTSNLFLSHQDIDALCSRFRTLSGRPFSEATPILDMDLTQYHTRIAAIGQPLTPKGTAFAFRRHRKKPWTLAHFIANNMFSAEAAGLLSFLVDGQASLLIAGSRGAGKTSLLSSLLLEIPQRYRMLTIEDTSEIPVSQLQHLGYKLQSLLTKSIASTDDTTEINPTAALRTALRLGESVLVIGEVRGVEAKVLFEAMRVGAAGNLIMGTIHGSTPVDVFERIVYDIGVPATSFKAVDAVVVAAPIRSKGGTSRIRRVTEISETVKHAWSLEITGDDVFQTLLSYDATKDQLVQLPRITIGQSSVIQQIAKRWGISVEQALENIQLRTRIKSRIAEIGQSTDEQFLEAPTMKAANNRFWMLIEEHKQQQNLDYEQIWSEWNEWFTDYVKRRTV